MGNEAASLPVLRRDILLGFFLFLFMATPMLAEPSAQPSPSPARPERVHLNLSQQTDQPSDQKSNRDLSREIGDCNWQVTYRGRQYDLSPLTREALSRPIENDIRFAIQRVPEAGQRLDSMTQLLRNARAHTLIATAFLGAFALFKVLEVNQNNKSQREDYRIASWASASFFLGATYFSWKSTRDAKDELVRAVDDFNARSPHKILPASASGGMPANQGLETIR